MAKISEMPWSAVLDGTELVPAIQAGTNVKMTPDDIAVRANSIATPHAIGSANHDADTLANLNAKVSDATLIDTGDARLSDARTPLAHPLGGAEHSASTLAALNAKVSDATLDDSSSSRTPTAHAASHETGGSDVLTPASIGAATSAQGSLADTAVQPSDLNTVSVNTQVASYTVVASDAGKVIEMDVAGANNVTVTTQPAGTVMEVHQYGPGATTLVADAGMTVLTPDTLVLDGQYATATLRWRTTTEVVAGGRLAAV